MDRKEATDVMESPVNLFLENTKMKTHKTCLAIVLAAGLMLGTSTAAHAAVIANPNSLTVSETVYTISAPSAIGGHDGGAETNNSGKPYSTTDTLQTAFEQGTPGVTFSGDGSIQDYKYIADAVAGNDRNKRYIPSNTNNDPNTYKDEKRDINIEFNSNWLGDRTLGNIDLWIRPHDDSRKYYDLEFFYTTQTDATPVSFLHVADVDFTNNNASQYTSGSATEGMLISISGFSAATFNDIDTITMRAREANLSTVVTHDQLLQVTEMDINMVPEPASLALLGLGGLAMIRRRRNA